MDISFDPVKRAATLKERGLDLADAGLVFAGLTITIEDLRRDYGETRFIIGRPPRWTMRGPGLDTPQRDPPYYTNRPTH